jgi:hypothetical protein
MSNLNEKSQKSNDLTLDKENLNRFNGLTLFLTSEDIGAEKFTNEASNLFCAIETFTSSRFKCDGGLEALAYAFREIIVNNPIAAEKYFDQYSELVNLLVSIYQSENFSRDFACVFEQMLDAEGSYDVDKHYTAENAI